MSCLLVLSDLLTTYMLLHVMYDLMTHSTEHAIGSGGTKGKREGSLESIYPKGVFAFIIEGSKSLLLHRL